MKKKVILSIMSLTALGLILLLGIHAGKENAPLPAFNIQFSPNAPKDLATDKVTDTQLVVFAWEEFLALNWKSSYKNSGLRDNPDLNWTFKNANPDLVVWETYAHRTELRPYNDSMLPFDVAPHYSFGQKLYKASDSTSFTLFNMLDENNEIGSCDVYAHVNENYKQYRVLYQAKVNRDEYNYILQHYPTKAKLSSARAYTKKMIDSLKAYYPDVKNSCNCPPDYKGISLPCGKNGGKTGAIEVKTAWRQLTQEDNPARFFTRTVVYFTGNKGHVVYHNKTYALIGLHIIHKTNNYEDFVFATWEHVDVQKDHMGYVPLDSNGNETNQFYKDYQRLHAIPSLVNQSTEYVHKKLRNMNPQSVWLNYRLVGVQGKPTKDSTSFNFFLANYVVESDATLGDFNGSGIGTPFDHLPNTLYKGQFISMGGCKGCHGVAQIKLGTDFSFLLDNVGKPVLRPDLDGDSSKLQRLIRATQ
ncbi:hypothetical protein [Chitinophaga sp. LS1]|uniref:hypothetical protein n=1 Tax=Chitinophaga sp. LS1 TaxID=3051176 RepID=UPI002AAA8A6B|nr:hypothetical protein [Chitinophaga sp. LS1]WPV69213.1 hypothetical protein QQL36_10825 [Chitinophaga sp. LS1]